MHVPAGFLKLLDNYERSTGITERVTAEELAEISLFLDSVLETEVMKVRWSRPFHRVTTRTPEVVFSVET